jgi:hypothetical protein
VNDSSLMSMLHPSRRRSHEPRARARFSEKFHAPLGESATSDKFHDQVRHTAIFARFVNRQHIRMIQFGHRLHFGPKPRPNMRRIEQMRENHLQRNDATHMPLHCPIHDTHAAVRDLFLYDKPGNELDAFLLFVRKCRNQTTRTTPSPLSFRQRCATPLAQGRGRGESSVAHWEVTSSRHNGL